MFPSRLMLLFLDEAVFFGWWCGLLVIVGGSARRLGLVSGDERAHFGGLVGAVLVRSVLDKWHTRVAARGELEATVGWLVATCGGERCGHVGAVACTARLGNG